MDELEEIFMEITTEKMHDLAQKLELKPFDWAIEIQKRKKSNEI